MGSMTRMEPKVETQGYQMSSFQDGLMCSVLKGRHVLPSLSRLGKSREDYHATIQF